MKTRRWFAVGLAAAATLGAVALPALLGDAAAQAKDWHYEKNGKILSMKGQNLLLDVGGNVGIYKGSTGLIYAGSSEDFLTDGDGKKIHLEIVDVQADKSEARIVEGRFSPSMLVANRRVVLRAKDHPAVSQPTTPATTSGNASSLPAASQLGTVCYPDGSSKPITPEAALWMAKMIDGETWGSPTQADANSMLWTIVQRSNIWGFKKRDWVKFIQAYSQPINPIWTRTGSQCAKYYAAGYTGSVPDNCSERRLAKREQNIKKGWNELPVLARQAVLDFAAAKIPNTLPGVVGWLDPGTWRKAEKSGENKREHHVLFAEIDGNSYYRHSQNPDTTAWTASSVRVVGPGQACK